MKCPKCDSERILQEGEPAFGLGRLAGLRKLRCKKCGHSFRSFDPLHKLTKSPKPKTSYLNRRLSPRYPAHLPTEISLIEATTKRGKVTYSDPSRGHCEAINRFGMGLSLVGSRFPEEALTRIGGLLFVRVKLPDATLEAVVSIMNHRRVGEDKKRKWFLGVKIHQLSELDRKNLLSYLAERGKAQPLMVSEDM